MSYAVDESTICVVAIAGQTFTGEDDDRGSLMYGVDFVQPLKIEGSGLRGSFFSIP
jgi:hypothetical protein